MGFPQDISSTAVIVTCAGAFAMTKLLSMGRRASDLPPGPPTRPVIGNLLDLPLSKPHIALTEMRKYGEICCLKIGYGNLIVLNSIEAVHHVLVTCNAATASRPGLYVLHYITGGFYLPFMENDANWRIMRKAVLETMSVKVVHQHDPIQAAESTQMMYDMLVDPENHFTHCRRYAMSIVTSIIFGRRLPRFDSYIAKTLQGNTDILDVLMKPGATPPVDLIPVLRHIPERWASWKTLMRTQRDHVRVFYNMLLSSVETRLQEGRGNGCLMETLLNRREEFGITREMIQSLGSSLLEPGEDSTKNYMQNFVRIIVNHPEEQEKAREEIDRVVGNDRLPTMDDLASLPYVHAIVQEVVRLRPSAPLSLPHKVTEDVAYKGFRIPEYAVIIPNVWCIFHDENLFEEPDTFRPQRFLDSPFGVRPGLESKAHPVLKDLAFGTGRRVCPAMHLSRNSLLLSTARLLWAFNLMKAKTADGVEIEVDITDNKDNSSAAPNPFKCDIRPRSPKHAQVIREAFIESAGVCSLFEQELDEEEAGFIKLARANASQGS